MFQITRRWIVVQPLIISPPLGLGDLLFFLRRPTIHLSVCLFVCNSDANLRKITTYNPTVYLVNDNVHTNFGLNKSIRSQDIEDKLDFDGNEGL